MDWHTCLIPERKQPRVVTEMSQPHHPLNWEERMHSISCNNILNL